MAQSIYYLGIFCGSVSVGFLADRFGRKPILLWGCGLLSLASCLAAACSDIWSFLACRFLQGLFEPGVWQVAFVIGIELVGPSSRFIAGLLIEYFFSLGMVILGLSAWLCTASWQVFQIAISVPGFLFLSYYWLMPESPRWLLANGRRQEAMKVIRQAAAVNKVFLDDATLAAIQVRWSLLLVLLPSFSSDSPLSQLLQTTPPHQLIRFLEIISFVSLSAQLFGPKRMSGEPQACFDSKLPIPSLNFPPKFGTNQTVLAAKLNHTT